MDWHGIGLRWTHDDLRPNGSAADLPFGDGPIDLGGVAGVAGRKLGFSMFWALGGPLGPQEGQNHMF